MLSIQKLVMMFIYVFFYYLFCLYNRIKRANRQIKPNVRILHKIHSYILGVFTEKPIVTIGTY